jgi:regulator of cell morphogenesis and NO signaling
MKMAIKAIENLIDENFVYAKVLNYFGVQFYENRGKTLKEICQENNLSEDRLKELLEKSIQLKPSKEELMTYPARLIIEYLKHSHQLFIKDRLPYILKLINEIGEKDSSHLISDLKFVMPMFVEDFIKHIYEEEDRLFHYVSSVEQYLASGDNVLAPVMIKGFSINDFIHHHGDSDDEMKGIRGITDQYNVDDLDDMHLKVILKELQQFDSELTHHASIENEILFPKAIQLEKSYSAIQNSIAGLN